MVNCYLHWHHTNLRAGEALIFVDCSCPRDFSASREGSTSGDTFLRSLSTLDSQLAGNPFLAGAAISIADLSAACEIAEHRFKSLDLSVQHVQEWMSLRFAGSPSSATRRVRISQVLLTVPPFLAL